MTVTSTPFARTRPSPLSASASPDTKAMENSAKVSFVLDLTHLSKQVFDCVHLISSVWSFGPGACVGLCVRANPFDVCPFL